MSFGKLPNPVVFAYVLGMAISLIVIVGGAVAAAWSPSYQWGDYLHDLVLLVLGIAGITFSLQRVAPVVHNVTNVGEEVKQTTVATSEGMTQTELQVTKNGGDE
jgi:hypothetical protein